MSRMNGKKTHTNTVSRKGKERKEVPVRNYSINTSINTNINKLQRSTNLMSRMNGKKTHTHTHTREDQCEWHRMTRMTGPDCVVMCNLINTHTHSERADAGLDGRTRLAIPNSQARTGTGKILFSQFN